MPTSSATLRIPRSNQVRHRLRPCLSAGLLVVLSSFTALVEAQTGNIIGQVTDQRTQQPVAAVTVRIAATHETFTDSRGAFRLLNVPVGRHTLRLSHLAFGERSVEIDVSAAPPTSVRVTLSDTAIALEPLTVEAVSTDELRARGAGFRRSLVTREALARAEGTNMRLADVLRSEVPSVRVRRLERVVGSAPCIELRSIRTTLGNECLSPAVYLDGVPITNPMTIYDNLDVSVIESIEVIPANEAGVRFGTGALFGALLIETRRPGRIADGETKPRQGIRNVNFDWASDEQGHGTVRVFASSAVGNALGLAAGVAIARQCLGLRKPSNDGLVSDCGVVPTVAAGAAGLLLPALGGALASRIAGQTDRSRGLFVPATVGAAMALVPGYALVFTGERNDSDSLRSVGYIMMTIGSPFITTASDYLFRRLRR